MDALAPDRPESPENLEAIEREARRLLSFARRDPDRVLPQYPSWTLVDLVTHLAGIHGRTALICTTLPTDPIAGPELPDGRDPFEWYEANLAAMLDGLHQCDRTAEVWTFVADRTLAAWERRMVIETGIHRWDAQAAFEPPDPLPDVVAREGLDEFGEMWLPRLGELPTIELHASDLGRAWRYGTGEPVARVAAPASDLFLRLMSRPGARLPGPWEAAVDGLATPADEVRRTAREAPEAG